MEIGKKDLKLGNSVVERRPDRCGAGPRVAARRVRTPAWRTRAPAWPEQHEQRQAAVQRWIEQTAGGEEEATHREPSRKIGSQAGRAEGPRGRDPAPSRRSRRQRRSLSRDVPAVWFGIDAGYDHRPRRPSGFRPARAPAPGGHGASGASLPLRALRHANSGFLSRRRHRPGSVRRSDRSHGGLPVALPAPARGPPGRIDEGSVRGRAVCGEHRADGPKQRRVRARRRRDDPRAGEIGAGQAHGRDRVPGRRAGSMVARRVHGAVDLLPGFAPARQPARRRRRHRRPRPLEAVLHDGGGAARAVQRPSPARVASPGRDREGGLGGQDAETIAPRLPRGKSRPGAGSGAETKPRQPLPTMLGRHHGRGQSPFTRPNLLSHPTRSRARPGAGDASRAASATTFSGAFRLARKMRYASSPISPCRSPTIRPSRTGA